MVLDGKCIYKNLLLVTLLFNSLYLASQDLYFKKLDPKYGYEEYGHSIYKSDSGDIYLVKAMAGQTSFVQKIYKISASGEVKDSVQISNGFLNTNDIIFDDQNLIVVGSEKSITDTIRIRKYDRNLNLLDSVALIEQIREFRSLYIHSTIEYNGKIVIAGTLRDKAVEDSIDVRGFLLFLNKDLTIDTIYPLVEPYRTQKLYTVDKSIDGNLALISFAHTQDNEQICCYYKVDKNHNLLVKKSILYPLGGGNKFLKGLCLENGGCISIVNRRPSNTSLEFDYNDALQYFENDGELDAVNSEGSIGSYRYLYNLSEVDNSSVIITGSYYGKWVPNFKDEERYWPLITKCDATGKTLWQRVFVNYSGSKKIYGESYSGAVGLDDGKIMVTGRGSAPRYVNGTEEAPAALILARLSHHGCLDEDRCNEVINAGTPIDSLFVYDQVNTIGKKWYYTVNDKSGAFKTMSLSFGKDHNLFTYYNGQPNDFGYSSLYRDVWITDGDGTQLSDYKMSWNVNGTATVRHKRNPVVTPGVPHHYDSLLYDFRLKVGDEFELPAEFGKAYVEQVDSILLQDGYSRKRIVLRHEKQEDHEAYGLLTWIEGIGAENGLLYFLDWRNKTKTSLNCYYDRDKKRYGEAPDCGSVFTAVQETESRKSWLEVYPNPAENEIEVLIHDEKGDIEKIEILDYSGKLMTSKKWVHKNRGKIDCSDWSIGMYLIAVTLTDGTIGTQKVIKM